MRKIILILAFASCNSKEITKIDNQEPETHCFHNGEILEPDYVHEDSLIVTNAAYLNYCLEQDYFTGDGEIAAILKVATIPFNSTKIQSEYQFNVDSKGYDIMNEYGQIIGRLNYGDNPTLDSLIIFDNQ